MTIEWPRREGAAGDGTLEDTMIRSMRGRAAGAGLIASLAGFGLLVGLAPAGAQADPPGNNGTVKVDDTPFDDHPNNEPHDGCIFQVDFYGYDKGDLSATVLFEAVPITVDDASPTQELLTDELAIGQDAAGGGTDLDASATYDLSEALAAIEPHAQQGWHVKLTVHAEGSQGADVKHKVFWVFGCETPTTTSTSSTVPRGVTTTVPASTTTTKPGTPTSTVPGTPPTSSTPGGSPVIEEPPTSVGGGTQTDDGTTPSTTATGSLPDTGSTTGPLVAAGVALVAAGVVTLGAVRLRRSS